MIGETSGNARSVTGLFYHLKDRVAPLSTATLIPFRGTAESIKFKTFV
jgi:hypothetical protein